MAKTILITGASTGFGRDTAETLAHAGHRVFASMRNVAERNRPHAEALRAKGVHIIDIDVTDEASIERGVASLFAQTARLDVLINNAGVGAAGISEAFTPDQLRSLFDVNVFGVQRTLRAVLPHLRRQGRGLVVNIGSVLGRITIPFFGLYGASKFALEAMTDSYRYELSQLGIDVVLVQPSAYPTNIFDSAQRPIDTSCTDAYGEAAEIGKQVVHGFATQFNGKVAPDPHDVAEAIRRIVEQPDGSRAPRVIVGQASGADVINDASNAVQTQLLSDFGLQQLGAPRVMPTAA
jgi:NAD(P)-dependent dehydrogenase (short-subunit alcohol dehydrogenase family)